MLYTNNIFIYIYIDIYANKVGRLARNFAIFPPKNFCNNWIVKVGLNTAYWFTSLIQSVMRIGMCACVLFPVHLRVRGD